MKAYFPIDVADVGIEICFNFEQPEKAEDPIFLINGGIFIVSMFFLKQKRVSYVSLFESDLKTRNLSSIKSNLFILHWIIEICVNFGHLVKIEDLIDSIDDGIEIFVNDEHPEKTESPIDVTVDGSKISINDEQ